MSRRAVVFDDPVMDDSDGLRLVEMGVGVLFGRFAMGCPAGMGDRKVEMVDGLGAGLPGIARARRFCRPLYSKRARLRGFLQVLRSRSRGIPDALTRRQMLAGLRGPIYPKIPHMRGGLIREVVNLTGKYSAFEQINNSASCKIQGAIFSKKSLLTV